jgi:hypothetical protein
MMRSSNKFKISPDFTLVKLLTLALLPFILLILSDYKRMEFDELVNYVVILILLSGLMLWLFTRPKFYYNDTTLYIIKGKATIEVSLSNIQSIEFSLIGIGLNPFSYKINYLTIGSKIASERLFRGGNRTSEFFDFIEKQNPNVKITRGLFG